MTDNNITRKKNTGEPTNNGGEFGSKKYSEPDAPLTPKPPTPAKDEFNTSATIAWQAERDYQLAAEDAIRETAANVPGAVTAAYTWFDDFDGGRLSFSALLDKNGEELNADDVEDELREFGDAFTDHETVRRSSGFMIGDDDDDKFTLEVGYERSAHPSRFSVDFTLKGALESAAHSDRKLGNLGKAGVIAVAREAFPDAATVILGNLNEGPGSPYFEVIKIQNGVGDTIWDYDDGTDNLADDFAEYAPFLDRLGQPLDKLHNNTWWLQV